MITEKLLQAYAAHIKSDYVRWWGDKDESESVKKMIEEFKITFKTGKSYIKVMKDGSVHSFIVNTEGNKFPYGTILKAASWKAPAMNFARAQIADTKTWNAIRWTGVS